MVASLQDTSLEEECFTQALQESHSAAAHTHTQPSTHSHSHSATHPLSHSANALALTHESAMKWFYKDPQGEIQGKLAHAHERSSCFFFLLRYNAPSGKQAQDVCCSRSNHSAAECHDITCLTVRVFLFCPRRPIQSSGDV